MHVSDLLTKIRGTCTSTHLEVVRHIVVLTSWGSTVEVIVSSLIRRRCLCIRRIVRLLIVLLILLMSRRRTSRRLIFLMIERVSAGHGSIASMSSHGEYDEAGLIQ